MERLRRMYDWGEDANGNISKPLFGEILMKLKKISDNPQCYDQRMKLVQQSLRSIGDVYSFWIENPELRKAYLTQGKQEKTMRREAQKGIQAVHNGWYFLSNIGQHGDFVGTLSAETIRATNGLVQGGDKTSGRFRNVDVTLDYRDYTPPSWQKVQCMVGAAITQVNELNLRNPLEAAIYAHLAIALIQPFVNGNKRTARLIQDRILDNAGLPPAIITAGEGKFYFDLLGKTAPAWRDGNPEGQKQFYDYIASKVNNGLDEILGDLRP